ncbi:MAG: discoidin domain-containing protein [Clostridia bacterium]|nr:discoidin domain-containing protein [Clostridia bacterium]
MKKFVAIFLVIAMTVALFGLMAFAEDTNIALGKNVEVEMTEGTGDPNMDVGFWDKNYLTDGIVPENETGVFNHLGWYAGTTTQDGINIALTIDLEAVAAVSKIDILPQKFLTGQSAPSDFTVAVSADGSNWDVVGEIKDNAGEKTEPFSFTAGKDARYVKVTVTKASAVADTSYFYSGFGEIEVYGTVKSDVVVDNTKKEVFTCEQGGIVWDGNYWLSNDTSTGRATVTNGIVINPSAAVEGIGVVNFWASNPNNTDNPSAAATIKISVYKYNKDYATSKAGGAVAEGAFTSAGDNNLNEAFDVEGTNCRIKSYNGTNTGIMIVPNTALEAGQYLIEIAETADTSAEPKDHYLVIPMTQEAWPNEKAAYYMNGEIDNGITTRIGVIFTDKGELLDVDLDLTTVDNPPETIDNPPETTGEEPETNVQTGDAAVAMFAVIAVLAMGAAVVFMKKKAF